MPAFRVVAFLRTASVERKKVDGFTPCHISQRRLPEIYQNPAG
ncbi:hypothetical protein XBFFL1_2200010 [Xenorhabdus bovienii str. feltiae Florida]|nr:hypothetical protein XBFFL1_2200010 [Xenorhabdus bovienii str. feltiae Florida]